MAIGVVPYVAVLFASTIVFVDSALVDYLYELLCKVLLDARIVLDIFLILGNQIFQMVHSHEILASRYDGVLYNAVHHLVSTVVGSWSFCWSRLTGAATSNILFGKSCENVLNRYYSYIALKTGL